MSQKTIITVVAVAVAIIVIGAAAFIISSGDEKSSSPVTLIDAEGKTVVIPSSDRIASTSLPMTEMICGMGGFDKLAGVTADTGNYVTQGSILGITDDGFPQSVANGLSNKTITDMGEMWQISAESVLRADPDLVIMGGGMANNATTIEVLGNIGIPVVICKDNSSLDNFYYNIELIGKAIRKESEAETLLDQMRSAIKKISDWAKAIDYTPEVGVFITFSETGAYATGSDFYKGTVLIEMLGGKNVFDKPGLYQLMTREGIIAIDPEVIITGGDFEGGDMTATFLDSLNADPILKSLSALNNDRIYLTKGTANRVFQSTSQEFVNAIAFMAMFLYEDYLDFEIEHYMGDNYSNYLNMFWEQINA